MPKITKFGNLIVRHLVGLYVCILNSDKMKKITLLGLSGLLTLGLMSSCDKYEDGPGISLVPRKNRMANTWVAEKVISNGEDVTDSYDEYELFMDADGDAKLTIDYQFGGTTITTETDGTWMFTNDEENVEFDFENDDFDNEFEILRLKTDELWLRDLDEETEFQLKEK